MYRFGYSSSQTQPLQDSEQLATCAPMNFVFGCLAITRFRAISKCCRGEMQTMKAPIRMTTQLFPAFIGLIDWFSSGIGGVDDDRYSQFATGLPDRVKPSVINFDQRAIRIPVFQTKTLEQLQTAHATFHRISQLLGGAFGETGAMARPACRVILGAISTPINIRKITKRSLYLLHRNFLCSANLPSSFHPTTNRRRFRSCS